MSTTQSIDYKKKYRESHTNDIKEYRIRWNKENKEYLKEYEKNRRKTPEYRARRNSYDKKRRKMKIGNSSHFEFRLDESMSNSLRAYAKVKKISIAEAIRTFVQWGLDADKD